MRLACNAMLMMRGIDPSRSHSLHSQISLPFVSNVAFEPHPRPFDLAAPLLFLAYRSLIRSLTEKQVSAMRRARPGCHRGKA